MTRCEPTIYDIDRDRKSFRRYLRSFDDYDALVKDLRKRFKFLGESGCYIFLYTVKEKVPEYHEWRERQSGRRAMHEVQRAAK